MSFSLSYSITFTYFLIADIDVSVVNNLVFVIKQSQIQGNLEGKIEI